jgi:tRNA pseudouridine38-40 synthase
MLAIGAGRRDPAWLAELLAARIRDSAVAVAPAHPLCLEEVRYPPDAELSARALVTRQVRHLPASPSA